MMPLIFEGIKQHTEPFLAWRWAMFVPAFMHIISGILILFFSTDLPDGNYAVLKRTGGMSKDSPVRVFWTACLNYRYAHSSLCALHMLVQSCQCMEACTSMAICSDY